MPAKVIHRCLRHCVQKLHLSEHAAYLRIEAARSAQRFSTILERLADGSLHLTAVSLLGPHLTVANHVDLLDLAKHRSKRDVEQLIARVRPQPDVPAVIRRLPAPETPLVSEKETVAERSVPTVSSSAVVAAPAPVRPTVIKPLAPERYKVQFTVSGETHERLQRVQDLMRHVIPAGDLSAIFDRALTLLLADLLKVKWTGAGIEPAARALKVRCSTTELPGRIPCLRPRPGSSVVEQRTFNARAAGSIPAPVIFT